MSIASEITRISNAKSSIKASIEAKGVTVGDGTLDTYSSKIDAIEQGITPTGTINITSNGTHDVTNYASANVNVSNNGTDEYFAGSISAGENIKTNIFKNIKKIPMMNLWSTSCQYMFAGCVRLETIPQLNTSNVINMESMFSSCEALTSIPLLDTSKVTSLWNLFNYCSQLTNLDGLENLGQAYDTTKAANTTSYGLTLSACTKLTHDSLMNIINNLYDIATKGCNTQKLTLGTTNKEKLTAEEIAIATNKGWTVL